MRNRTLLLATCLIAPSIFGQQSPSAKPTALTGQKEGHEYLHDQSDWWASDWPVNPENAIKTQERELPASNLQILGIELTEDMFVRAAAKLGKVGIVDRGDASTGRSQACYVSSQDGEKVHLIFEQGEVDYGFYLFVGGADWYGSNRCATSKLVSPSVSTKSGLHLGQSPSEVVAILGKPSLRRGDELFYSLHATKKNSAEDMKKIKQWHPEMTDQGIQESYGVYDLSESFHAKFVDSKMTYLYVSTAETN
jgi:hypothetical protein